jgi:hypothetical protein
VSNCDIVHGAPRTVEALTEPRYHATERTVMGGGSELHDPLGAQQYSDAGRPGRQLSDALSHIISGDRARWHGAR